MANHPRKKVEYLKKKHRREADIRLDNERFLALLAELSAEEAEDELLREAVAARKRS